MKDLNNNPVVFQKGVEYGIYLYVSADKTKFEPRAEYWSAMNQLTPASSIIVVFGGKLITPPVDNYNNRGGIPAIDLIRDMDLKEGQALHCLFYVEENGIHHFQVIP